MKKYFIADLLTFAKAIPALMILIFIGELESGQVFILFAIGEFLDALDGMAAKKWPHPPETDQLWVRKNLKLIESGLDLFLGVATLFYITIQVNFSFGIFVLMTAVFAGGACELVLYGRFFGTPETAKEGSLFRRNPEEAKKIVGYRLAIYCILIFLVLLLLIADSFWPLRVKMIVSIAMIVVVAFLILVKDKDGRINLHRFFE